jgi:hypothetical protein
VHFSYAVLVNIPMPTLRRILKYTPAIVMGLLAMTWVVSWFALRGFCFRLGDLYIALGNGKGCVLFDAFTVEASAP